MLKRIFGRHLNVSNDFADTADNFITFYSLHLAGSIHKNFLLFYLFIVCLFAYAGHDATITSMFFSMFCFYISTLFFMLFCDELLI